MAPPTKASTPNTLFNYFARAPSTPQTPRTPETPRTPATPKTPPNQFVPAYDGETPKRPPPTYDSDGEEMSESDQNRKAKRTKAKARKNGDSPQAGPSRKSTEDSDYSPQSASEPESVESESGESESMDEDVVQKGKKAARKRKISSNSDTEEEKVEKKKPKISFLNRSCNKDVKKTPAKPSKSTPKGKNPSVGSTATLDETEEQSATWPHLAHEFLKPDRICDQFNNRPEDPEYDCTTLFIPSQFYTKQTPGHKQWWDFKKSNFDAILFFKVGRFYELYHMDAVIAAEVCSLAFMKGDYAHVGFPEKSYSKYANIMIEKGYKVARVEQTETPEMLQERTKGKSGSQKDKVVSRSICQISTRGVRIPTFQDDPYASPFTHDARYLYGIFERLAVWGRPEFGVCFIDTTIGEFHIGQFEDDRHFSRLRTLLSHYLPVQVIVGKGNLDEHANQLINSFTEVRKDVVKTQFFQDAAVVLRKLTETNSFYDHQIGGIKWPSALQTITKPGCTSPEDGWDIGLQAFGGVITYLKECLIGHDMLSLKRFTVYRPVDSLTIPGPENRRLPSNMVLDGITLQNLDLTEGKNNLLSLIDSCWTPFGKRLIREWLCMPLAVPRDIEDRLDAIDEVLSLDNFAGSLQPLLKSLPDLDRLLNKVHILGSLNRKFKHPESKAIMFDEPYYSKNKITDLMSVIKGFKTCIKILDLLKENNLQSRYLSTLVCRFPSLKQELDYFDTAFDHQEAIKDGKIVPKPGANGEYDENAREAAVLKRDAHTYLVNQSVLLNSTTQFFGNDKKAYQMEVPDWTRVPSDFQLSSSKKGFKRYVNEQTKALLSRSLSIASRRSEILRDATRAIFEKFDSSHELWKSAVDCVAKLDVIISLTTYSTSQINMCRPKVVHSDKPFIKIKDGRHPCMPIDVYIANSCNLGLSNSGETLFGTFLLLTGPNMGGKSTLMRQVALLSILSHLGCYVPATVCEMSLIDRVFTRLGASDNIGEGESTFFVELSETSSALRHCTKNSLVLMDELGRGTATYDGTAIAYAVSSKLAKDGIRTLFSTHYHTLVESVQTLSSVQLGHMACMVENENDEDPTKETITFLYKLIPGPCPKSYGFNAARLAGLPDQVIRIAHQKAKEFEATNNAIDAFRKIALGFKNNTLCLSTALKLLKV